MRHFLIDFVMQIPCQALCFRHQTTILVGILQEKQIIKFNIKLVCDTFIFLIDF